MCKTQSILSFQHTSCKLPESVTHGYDQSRQVPTRIVGSAFDLNEHGFFTVWSPSTACQHENRVVTSRNNLPLQVSVVLPLSASSTASTVNGLNWPSLKLSLQSISCRSSKLCAGQLRRIARKSRQYRQQDTVPTRPSLVAAFAWHFEVTVGCDYGRREGTVVAVVCVSPQPIVTPQPPLPEEAVVTRGYKERSLTGRAGERCCGLGCNWVAGILKAWPHGAKPNGGWRLRT
jgi:hypothetical protein